MKKTSAILALFLLSCWGNTPKVPGTPESCAAAQVRLSELGCREAKSPRGRSYESICVNKLQEGIDLRSLCIAQIKSCEEVDACSKSQ